MLAISKAKNQVISKGITQYSQDAATFSSLKTSFCLTLPLPHISHPDIVTRIRKVVQDQPTGLKTAAGNLPGYKHVPHNKRYAILTCFLVDFAEECGLEP